MHTGKEVRRRVATIAMTTAFATARNVPPAEESEDDSWKTASSTREQIESLATPITQLESGQVIDGDTFFEQLYREKGWAMKP